MKQGIILSGMVAGALAIGSVAMAQKTYTVNETATPPAIDGVVTAGEWADAAPAAGNFEVLRQPSGTTSAENITFQMMYDANNLYLLIVSDYDSWAGDHTGNSDGTLDFTDTLEVFWDPNRDGEANAGGDTSDDSYQIQIEVAPGTFVRTAAGEEPFIAPAARVDGLFGDNTTYLGNPGWGSQVFADILVASVADGTGAVVEYQVPFSIMQATSGTDTGLDIGGTAPADAETWHFNIGRISSAAAPNDLPIWNWHAGDGASAFFAERPHGEITFNATPASVTDYELYD